MKRKILLTLTAVLALSLSVFCLTACEKVQFRVEFIVEKNVYATIDTNGKELIKMPNDPTKENYVFDGWYWDEGVWKTPFTANSLLDAPLSSNMRVYAKFSPKEFTNVSFEDVETVYDGTEKTICVNNLPSGAVVEYDKDNTYINAGEYEVTATISQEGYPDLVLTAKLKIHKARYNVDNVEFTDKAVTYNGEQHSIEATNLPVGVTATYESTGNNINAGEYTITAKLSGDSINYEPIQNKTAKLVINKANYNIGEDVFEDKEVVYSGEVHLITTKELPQGVSVKYYFNNKIFTGVSDVGEYEITAKFVGDNDNYNAIPDKVAFLTINAKQLDTPVITKVEYDTIYWQGVEGADYYLVRVNDNYECTLRGNSCPLSSVKWNGDSIIDYGMLSIKVMAQGSGNYNDSKWSETDDSYFYVPAVNSETVNTLIKHSIGFGYNIIEDGYLDVTKCSQKSIFNVGKLLTIGNYTSRANSSGNGTSYSYSTIDEFISKTSANFEYANTKGCVLLGSMKTQISASASFNYKKYEYKNTYIYEYNITYKDHIVTNFSSEDLLYYCLSDHFLKDIKRESAETINMTDDMLVEYLYNTYGTHAILGVTTGGSWSAKYTIGTTKKDIAASIAAGFNASTAGGGAIDQVIQSDFSIGIQAKQEIESNSETTQADFKTIVYGGTGGAAGNLDAVNEALLNWSGSMSEENAMSIKFTENGAISISYLLSLFDISFSNKFSNYVDKKTTEQYKSLYEQYSTAITLPIDMQTEDGKNVLTIDLSEFQENGNIGNVYYPTLEDNVLTVYPIMFAKNIDVIVIKGAYDVYDILIEDFSIKFSKEWKNDINILIENVGVYGAKGIGFIDITDLSAELAVNLQYAGKNKIAGHDANATAVANSAIKVSKLNICSLDADSSLIISGGNGYSATSAGGNGTNGVTAIVVEKLSVDLTKGGLLDIIGGSGGHGKDGARGSDGVDNDRPGSDGGNGGNGGNGASAIIASEISVLNASLLNATAGNGGNGGNGGRGGDGSDDNLSFFGSAHNGVGGNGGNGGNGGTCANAIECNNIYSEGVINCIEGIVGNGGCGGNGGNGGDATAGINVPGSDGGTGGIGGLYGDGITRAPNGSNGKKGD